MWTPDAAHEAVRDLVRAREAAADDLRRKRRSCFPFCCGTSRISAEAATGRWRIGAGWPTRSSNMPRSRSSFRKGSTRSKMRFNACVALRNSSLSITCRVVDGRSWQPTRRCAAPSFLVAVTFAAEIGDVRRFDTPRQLMSFLDLVPRGTLDRRYNPTEGPHLSGRPARAASTHRGGLDIPLSRRSQRGLEARLGSAAKARARHRLESTDPSVRPLPSAQRHR